MNVLLGKSAEGVPEMTPSELNAIPAGSAGVIANLISCPTFADSEGKQPVMNEVAGMASIK